MNSRKTIQRIQKVVLEKKHALLLHIMAIERFLAEEKGAHHSIEWEKSFYDSERYGHMIGDELKTCLECIAVTAKCLDGKILHHVKNRFLNLIYIKSAEDRKLKIILLNWASLQSLLCTQDRS